ncbi:hypothetical protein AAVH_38769, partial [Aphelenchoides avenae]
QKKLTCQYCRFVVCLRNGMCTRIPHADYRRRFVDAVERHEGLEVELSAAEVGIVQGSRQSS